METILAYAPTRGTALRAASRTSSYRVAINPEQLEREIETFKPPFVMGDQGSSEELVRLVGDRAAVVVVDATAMEQVRQVVRILEIRLDQASGEVTANVRRATTRLPGIRALHDSKTGRLDAVRIARWLGVSLNQFAGFLGRPVQTIHKTPASKGLQPLLTTYERIATSLLSLFQTRARSRIWLNAPHPDLDEATPMSLLARRKPDVVAQLLEDALLGQPG